MGSLLGFRPPHFSEEEEAWLPPWLQPSTLLDCPSSQPLEETGRIQQSIIPENGILSNDGTCKSLHLFLSGDDNTPPINFTSCSTNHEVRFHLHLSTNEESQYSLNPTSNSRSQADKSQFNPALLVQPPEAKVIPSQQHVNLSPSFKANVDARCRKGDISDAIELAVGASEALTIHEVLKDELVASFVLEAAIRVKQARLENFRESISSSLDESNEVDCDFFTDLDHLDMADAYEDVGLTVVTSHNDPSGYGSVSHVNDSFASENFRSKSKYKCKEFNSGSSSPKLLEHVYSGTLDIENANLACDVDPVFNCSSEQTAYCATEVVSLHREDYPNGDLTSSHTVLRSNNSEREDKMTNLVPDRFQSRWFGGWTSKNDVSVPALTNDKRKRIVPELFVINETSFLSESADIAPDMNSCVQRHDDKHKTVSQSSVAPQYAYEKANNNGDLISDDVAVSPNVSPIDPLCSVVPCSFTSDTVASHNSEHQVILEKHLDHTVQPNLDSGEVICETESPPSPTIRRQGASLKTYSTLYRKCGPYLNKEHTRVELPSSEQNQTAKADTELTIQKEKEMTKIFRNVESIVPRRKRVRFSETKISYPEVKKFKKSPQTRLKDPLVASRIIRRLTSNSRPHEVKKSCDNDNNKTLFQDLCFLLTGFSVKKHKQIKVLIQKNGGIVFDDIPSPPTSKRKRCQKLPLILCPKKLLTTKFLYGCAVNAEILKVSWLFDSVDAGLILPHQNYKVLKDHTSAVCHDGFIFNDIAIMLHGKPDFCNKMAKVIKHGGGLVFKTFHWLVKSLDSKKVSVGIIVVEDENGIPRQLKQCALEQKIPMMPFSWIINSLYAGRLLPSPQFKPEDRLIHLEMSEEI